MKTLNHQSIKILESALAKLSEDCENAWRVLVERQSFDFVEVCRSPESNLSKECDRQGGRSYRLNLANGFDLMRKESVASAATW